MAYVGVLLLTLFTCLNMRFGMDWEALLNSPAGDRLILVADAINTTLCSNDENEWDAVLRSYGAKYGARFLLFDSKGQQLAGDPLTLPPAVRSKLEHPNFRHTIPLSPPEFSDDKKFLAKHGHVPPIVRWAASINRELWIGIAVSSMDGAHNISMPVSLVVVLDNFWHTSLLFDFGFVIIAIGAVVIFTLAFWWPFAYSITSRIRALTVASQKIADGDLDTRTNPGFCDELGQLAISINLMGDRLKAFLQAQKRVVGDISHELVTPLARLDMAIELLQSAEGSDKVELLSEIKEEIRDMHHLVGEILAFTKAGLKGKPTELVVLSVEDVVQGVVAQLRAKDVAVKVDPDLRVVADPLFFSRAISNVVRNCLRYAGDLAVVEIVGRQDDNWVSIFILDRGPGVPQDSIQHLGEPFFRPEYSRNRESGGAGLGLAIAKSCIESCGGTIEFGNRPGGGFQVEIRLQEGASQPLSLETIPE